MSVDWYNDEELLAQIKHFEGSKKVNGRHIPYKDSKGLLTTGYGRNIDAKGFSEDEVTLMLSNDLKETIELLDKNIPWWRDLSPVRQRVMIDLCYNMGWGNGIKGLSTFKNTLELIRTGKYTLAATNLENSKWAKDVGERRYKPIIKALRDNVWPSLS